MAKLKEHLIGDMREHRLSYCETVRKYELGSTKSGAVIGLLQRRERIFLEEGAEGLLKERRGRQLLCFRYTFTYPSQGY